MFEQLLITPKIVSSESAANVIFVMNMDGTNGGTTFNEKYGAIILSVGSTTSSTQAKFGSTSYRQSNTAAYLSTSNQSGLFDFAGDFTIDFWYYYVPAEVSSYGTFFDIGGQSLSCQIAATTPNIIIYSNVDSAMQGTVGIPHNLVANSWNHMVVQRRNNTYYFGRNGTLITYKTSGSVVNLVADRRYTFTIGNYSVSRTYGTRGYMDEFRITKGIARYLGPTYDVPITATS